MISETLSDLVDPHRASLTSAERALVESLASHASDAMFMSAKELANSAGVHQSSAVRLAKKLGFEGYPEFRRAMQSRLADRSGAAVRVARTVAGSEGGDIVGDLVAKELAALQSLAGVVVQGEIDAAARQLVRARVIYVWAAGNAKTLADLLVRRLCRAGFVAIGIAHEGRALADALVPMQADDAVLCFAFRREPVGLGTVLGHATRVGSGSVLIADALAYTMAVRANVQVVAPRGEAAEFLSLTVPMLITNALILTLASIDGGRSIAGLQVLDSLHAAMD